MSHGEQWMVPLNYFLIAGTVILWAIAFPLWTTLLIAIPIALVLSYFAWDKYGGMAIVMFIAVGWFSATAAFGRKYYDLGESQADVNVGYLMLRLMGAIVLCAIGFFLCLVVLLALRIGWEWILGKFGFGPCAKRVPVAADPAAPAQPGETSQTTNKEQ